MLVDININIRVFVKISYYQSLYIGREQKHNKGDRVSLVENFPLSSLPLMVTDETNQCGC